MGKIGSEAEAIEEAINKFIRIKEIQSLELSVEIAIANLDEGEKQAIGLASTFSADTLLLLDDRAGRKVAQFLGIPVTGLIGLLLLSTEAEIFWYFPLTPRPLSQRARGEIKHWCRRTPLALWERGRG